MNIKKSIALILMVIFMGTSMLPLVAAAKGNHHAASHKIKVFKKHAHHRAKYKLQKRHMRPHAKKHVRRHIRKHD